MAIKGKKKAGSRGSQARRRPAGAPRPAHIRREHTPWYRTSGGRVTVAVVAALLVSGAAGIVAAINSSNNEREARHERIEAFTDRAEALASAVADPATQMSLIPGQVPRDVLSQIEAQAPEWIKAIQDGQGDASQLQPPDDFSQVGSLFTETIMLYQSAAETYRLAVKAEGELQVSLLERAADQRDRATTIFTAAIGVIDEERDDEGLNASGIANPATSGSPTTTEPSPSPTLEGN